MMLFTQPTHYPANATTRKYKRPVLLRKSTREYDRLLFIGNKIGKAQHFVKNYDRERKGLKWESNTHPKIKMYTDEKPAESNVRKITFLHCMQTTCSS